MAKTKIKLKKGGLEGLLEEGYDPREILRANPGTVTFSPGQEVFVPNRILKVDNEIRVDRNANPAGNTSIRVPGIPGANISINGSGLQFQPNINLPFPSNPPPQANPPIRQDPRSFDPRFTNPPVTGGSPATLLKGQEGYDPRELRTNSGMGVFSPSPLTPSGAILQPLTDGRFRITAADGTTSPDRPAGMYEPGGANAQSWRDLWNWQAAHPYETREALTAEAIAAGKPDPFAVHVPTRAEIWNMKAEQRRRGAGENASSGGGGFNPANFTGNNDDYWNFGNASQALTWRVG